MLFPAFPAPLAAPLATSSQAIKRGSAEDETENAVINMRIKSVMTLPVTLNLTHSAWRKDIVLQTQGDERKKKEKGRSYK